MKTRGKGEGSIYQRQGDGKWCAAVTLADGRKRVLYADSRKEVADKLKAAQANLQQALPIVAGRETVTAFMERWLTDTASKKVRETTLARYTTDVKHHIIPGLGRKRLVELTPGVVQKFVNDLTAKGLGPRGVNHCRAVLRVALQQAVRESLIGQNPAKLVITPQEHRTPVEALSPADAQALLAAMKGDDLEPLILLALATGMRQGELLGLTWADIDLDAGTVRVKQQLQRIGGAYRLVPLKTHQSRRTLALPLVAVSALREQRAWQEAQQVKAGASWVVSALVFTTTTGRELNGPALTHRFQKRLLAAGLPARKFHHLRHGAASLLLAQGASMRVVMEQLGHSQIALTMNTYTHIVPALMRDAADRLNTALGGDVLPAAVSE